MMNNIEQSRSMTVAALRFCFYITLISDLIIYISQPLNITILVMLSSRCFMLTNLVAFFLIVSKNIKPCIPNKTFQTLIIFIIICASFISFLLSSSCGMYHYVIRLLGYLALPFYFVYLDYIEPSKRMLNIVFTINFLISFVFILLSFSNYKYAGYENFLGTSGAWLTLGYNNPNQTAMYLLLSMIILYCALNYYTKKIARILILFDIIYSAKLLLETSSRTCILIAILITVIIVFKKKYTVPKYITTFVLLLPLIVMLIYPFLYENRWIYSFEFGGKTDFSSRSYMFRSVLIGVKDRVWFGDFGINQLNNLHNGVLSVYASLGLAGLILFYIYYYKTYFNIYNNGFKSRTAYISFIGLLAIFIHACTEGAFITGGSMYAGTISILIFLAKVDLKEVKV